MSTYSRTPTLTVFLVLPYTPTFQGGPVRFGHGSTRQVDVRGVFVKFGDFIRFKVCLWNS